MAETSALQGNPGIRPGNDGTLICSGPWTVNTIADLPPLDALALPADNQLVMNGAAIASMDTAGAWQVTRICRCLEAAGRRIHLEAFRPEHETLINLVRAAGGGSVPGVRRDRARVFADRCKSIGSDLFDFLAFIGETVVSLMRAMQHPGRIRWNVIIAEVLDAGYKALPIVGLLSFLMGVVIAYQGAVQLQLYGANIYVADLVGYSMLRELAPLLTAILVSGRTGSAYTAQIATMQVTEEVAALRTIGIPPMDILVLPKLIALIIAMPLLSVFADVMAVAGGMLMSNLQLGIGFNAFLIRLGEAVSYSTFMIGIGKAPVFAAIIAIVGCYQGFKVDGGAESVGRHTTISVVQSIFLVIVADAMFSILFSMLGV